MAAHVSDYDDLIKQVQPYYNDLPVEGMKALDELVNTIRDLLQEKEAIRAAKTAALKIADERAKEAVELRARVVEAKTALDIVRILANTPPNEWLRKSEIHAGLAEFRVSFSGENGKK